MRTLTFNRVVGSGAMGTVYHAELRVPRGFSRTCAVKVMKTQGPDHDHFRGRMRDEARLLGILQDEQVLGVSELVTVEGRDAVIMEFVEGLDLSEVIKAGKMPPKALAELGAEVAGTLHRAHTARHPQTGASLKVIHRDIKPANIMVTSRGGVRVLDFGVARAAFASRESQTQGLVLGTLNYFPPEILAGQDPTPSVDIYGLGLTLWECATGQEWGAPRVQRPQFEKRVDQRLAQLPSDCAPLQAVLRQVLQWDPDLRPDGGGLERMLLAAAEECPGQGLRVWSREVVPQLIQAKQRKSTADPLVGRTVDIDGDEAEPPAPPPKAASKAPSARPDPQRAPKGERNAGAPATKGKVDAWRSFDDFGPPSAAARSPAAPPPPAERSVSRPAPKAAPKPTKPRRKKAGGGSVVAIAFALILGSGLLALLVVAVGVLVILLAMN